MAYTVKNLARLSGVSVRTLHFYDETGLLKPAYHGANGYRYYEEEQLLMLQQILFFRELGFELKRIGKIIGSNNFDKIVALRSHRQVLEKDGRRIRKLLNTIDQTIEHLKGKKKMKDQAMYNGFSKEKQAEYEKELIGRFGEKARANIAESHRKVKNWTKTDWEKSGREFDQICKELVKLKQNQLQTSSDEVQTLVRRHYQWLKRFWTPNRESYAGHSQFIVESDLRKAYDAYHPELADFLAAGMKVFAKRELS